MNPTTDNPTNGVRPQQPPYHVAILYNNNLAQKLTGKARTESSRLAPRRGGGKPYLQALLPAYLAGTTSRAKTAPMS